MTRLIVVVVAVTFSASACTSKEPVETRRRDPAPTSTTTDPRITEEQAVRAARQAAEDARIASGAPPGSNPAHPALAATHMGAALEWVSHVAELDQRNRVVWVYPPSSQRRLDVRSVAFPGDTLNVAWLDTCVVDDQQRADATSGAPRQLGYAGPLTLDFTEVMHRDAGTWKVAERWLHSYTEGIAGCATQTPPRTERDSDEDRDRRAVIDARQAAERAWLAYLTDPATAAPPTDTHSHYAAQFYENVPLDQPSVSEHCPATATRPRIRVDLSGATESAGLDDCVRNWFLGHNAGTHVLRSGGIALTGTSTVEIHDVAFPAGDGPPDVAYLTTCRTHQLTRTDEQGFIFDTATIHSTDVMRRDAVTWKLATRGDITVAPPDHTGCSPPR